MAAMISKSGFPLRERYHLWKQQGKHSRLWAMSSRRKHCRHPFCTPGCTLTTSLFSTWNSPSIRLESHRTRKQKHYILQDLSEFNMPFPLWIHSPKLKNRNPTSFVHGVCSQHDHFPSPYEVTGVLNLYNFSPTGQDRKITPGRWNKRKPIQPRRKRVQQSSGTIGCNEEEKNWTRGQRQI